MPSSTPPGAATFDGGWREWGKAGSQAQKPWAEPMQLPLINPEPQHPMGFAVPRSLTLRQVQPGCPWHNGSLCEESGTVERPNKASPAPTPTLGGAGLLKTGGPSAPKVRGPTWQGVCVPVFCGPPVLPNNHLILLGSQSPPAHTGAEASPQGIRDAHCS